MQIGINGASQTSLGQPAAAVAAHAAAAEADGFATYWLAQPLVPDALTLMGLLGPATSTIEIGTAVIPTWTRHPLMLAAQALTTSELCGGRVALGIGLAHKPSVEGSLEIPFERPAANMREYLDVLLPALRDRAVDASGEIWSGHADSMGGPAGIPTPAVLLAAMGPRLLELAGSRTDGTILWLSGPKVIEAEIAPALRAAADRAGRPAPRIVASVPVCVTDDPEPQRALIAQILDNYNHLPSYRRVMDIEGISGPADVSLVGDEDTVRAGLARFEEAGVTDFSALEFTLDAESAERTRALLKAALPR